MNTALYVVALSIAFILGFVAHRTPSAPTPTYIAGASSQDGGKSWGVGQPPFASLAACEEAGKIFLAQHKDLNGYIIGCASVTVELIK